MLSGDTIETNGGYVTKAARKEAYGVSLKE